MEPEEEFAAEAAKLFSTQIERFVAWLEKSWEMSARDAAEYDPARSEEYREGWNAALASIPAALELYLEPNG